MRATTIVNTIQIERPIEAVFDYCTEPANEAEWNPRTRWIQRVTVGPVAVGFRYDGEWIKGSPMSIVFERVDRPTAWSTLGRSRRLDARTDGQLEELAEGTTRLRVTTTLMPHRSLAALAPVLGSLMRRREQRNLSAIKAALERKPLTVSMTQAHQELPRR